MTNEKRNKIDYRKVLGDSQTREEVMERIQTDAESYQKFQSLTEDLQAEIVAFAMGNWGVKVAYDPIFKYVFNPAIHPERLSELISLILGEEVTVVSVMPNESDRLTDKGSLLIMDILVKLESGALANVEIQKIGYTFPGQRCVCYSSDLLMRQLARVKQELGENFSYRHLKKVYSIILIEKSNSEYHRFPEVYIHRGRPMFETGLEMEMLQEFVILPLDIFKGIQHNEISKLDAWLYFLSSDDPKDISRIVELYPQFKEYYAELLMFRYQTKELIEMYDVYREALRVADRNAVKYMVEEQKKEIEEQKKALEEQKREIEEQRKALEEQQKEVKEWEKEAEEHKKEAEEHKKEAEELRKEIERLKAIQHQL